MRTSAQNNMDFCTKQSGLLLATFPSSGPRPGFPRNVSSSWVTHDGETSGSLVSEPMKRFAVAGAFRRRGYAEKRAGETFRRRG